ncbi:MAG: hypothetical protein RL885_19175 [Planctomycetota bacterium]
MRATWLVLCVSLSACMAPRPSPEEIAAADVGPPPREEEIRLTIDEYFDDLLPVDALEIERREACRAYHVDSRSSHSEHFGWRVTCLVTQIADPGDTRQEAKAYDFYFQGDRFDAIGFRDRLMDGRDVYSVLRLSTGGAPIWRPDSLLADPGEERFELPFY